MERVTFLIERTGDQLACLLNPESLVLRRESGVQARESTSGQLTGFGLSDQPLLFTGGGTTEIDLDLLFDVSLAGSTITTRNVRDLTGPLWNLAENREDTGYGRPPLIRFLWGKTFNLPGIVVGVAERLERFTEEGIPTRSWLRLRVVRVDEKALEEGPSGSSPSPASLRETAAEASAGGGSIHSVTGGTQRGGGGEGEVSSVTSPSDIVTSAFATAGVTGIFASAQAAISGTINTLSNGANQLREAEDEETAAEQLEAAAETFGQALDSAAQGVQDGNLSVVGGALEQMFSAAGSAASAVSSLVSERGRAIAEEVNRALEAVGSAAEKMLTATQTVVREVVQRSARVLATAVANTDRMIDRVSTTAEDLASAASNAIQQAGTSLQSGVESIRSALERIRAAGELAAVEFLPKAVQQISRSVDRMRSAGAGIAAERTGAAIEGLAVWLKNMKAATEAIGSVMEHTLSGFLHSMTDTLRATVASVRDSEDFSRLYEVSVQLQALARSVLSGGPQEQASVRDQAKETVQSLQTRIEEVLDDEESERLSEIFDLLPSVEEATEALEAAEQEEVTTTIIAAVPVRGESPLSERGIAWAEHTPESGGQRPQGERLDQIAFRNYGSSVYWRLLALHNEIDHPLHLPSGLQLSIPSAQRTLGS